MKPVIRFIINPISGQGKGEQVAALVEQSDIKNKFEIEICKTKHRGHAVELAKEAAEKKYHGVIAVGGDGTVNEIASSLVKSETAFIRLQKTITVFFQQKKLERELSWYMDRM